MEELSLSGKDLYDLMVSWFVGEGDRCAMKINCKGGSMSPFIRENSTVTIKPVNTSRCLKKGDIVALAVHNRKRIIVHRIVRLSSISCFLKGDNNRNGDGWFERKDILGKVGQIEMQSGFKYTPKSWQNLILAWASQAGLMRLAGCLFRLRKFALCKE